MPTLSPAKGSLDAAGMIGLFCGVLLPIGSMFKKLPLPPSVDLPLARHTGFGSSM